MTRKQNKKIVRTPHATWHKFYDWVIKTYGSDLHGKWEYLKIKDKFGKVAKKIKHRSFNEWELSKRLVGYEVMCKMERFINRCCPEIKIIRCDDSLYAGSFILLIPHPKHGITMMFIPQCTSIQNQMFLYESHYQMLMKELSKMKTVYKNSL